MLNFQEMIAKLTQFWAEQGCVVHQGYDLEVGAGTFNPATFLRCLGPEPYSAVYVEPSRRPKDGRYGENPNRVQFYHQMQVIMKPSPPNIQELYLKSLESIGLNLNEHDIRFVHDDWENPTIGAWGLGWEIWLDGMEVTQFTYFQAVGGLPVNPVSGEITYGLERLAMYLQGVDSFFDLKWNDKILYGDVFKRSEWEWSHYNFTEADTTLWMRHFNDFEAEAKRLIGRNLPIPAYDFVMKTSHAFNILDARGVISVTERTGYIGRIRALAKELAETYLKSREQQAFPLMRHASAPKKKVELPALNTKWSPEEKEDFLLEIGSEELPATFVPIGLANLQKEMEHLLKEKKISYDHILPFGTPRRLALLIKGLRGGTAPEQMEKKGPSLQAAFDEKGLLTKAGAGFLKGLGMEATLDEVRKGKIPALTIRTLQGTDYLFATTRTEGTSTREVLATALPSLILSIDFPKKMRWGSEEIEYARPLRWLTALYGKEIIPFAIGELISGRASYGHRQLAPQKIDIEKPSDYLAALRKVHVMADIQERKEEILKQLETLEKEVGGKATAHERVLPQVLHLVEWPFVTSTTFDPSYLQAPKEVLISEMVEHQKYFPVVKNDGTLLPCFFIVCNNKPTDLIRHGNQKALAPRLADGYFLYQEDLKISLDTFNKKLEAITFQKDLGSVRAKVKRIEGITEILHENLPLVPIEKAKRAATLCKFDLATLLVGEFPELQGIIGSIYAKHAGEDPEVSTAIDEHWMPKGEKAPLPQTSTGVLVSLADKIDNLLSCFSLGLVPTSSSDPYALRRQALGMIKMLIHGKHFLSLSKVLNQAMDLFLHNPELSPAVKKHAESHRKEIIEQILSFLGVRLRTVFLEMGFEKDEIEAILVKGTDDVYDSYTRTLSLHEFRLQHPEAFHQILEVFTRSKKILLSKNLKSESFATIDHALLRELTEQALFKKLEETKHSLSEQRRVQSKNYPKALSLLAELALPVADLFESVKILDDNPKVSGNRLALLQEVRELCEEVADFSKIQEHED